MLDRFAHRTGAHERNDVAASLEPVDTRDHEPAVEDPQHLRPLKCKLHDAVFGLPNRVESGSGCDLGPQQGDIWALRLPNVIDIITCDRHPAGEPVGGQTLGLESAEEVASRREPGDTRGGQLSLLAFLGGQGQELGLAPECVDRRHGVFEILGYTEHLDGTLSCCPRGPLALRSNRAGVLLSYIKDNPIDAPVHPNHEIEEMVVTSAENVARGLEELAA